MAKRRIEKQTKNELLPTKYQDAASVVLLLIALLLFFHQVVFEGKVFLGGDRLAMLSFHPYLDEAKQEGVFPLWIPYFFGGMPSYASLIGGGTRWWDLSEMVWRNLFQAAGFVFPNSEVTSYLFLYFLLGAGLYLFMRSKGAERSASLVAALAGMFSTFIIAWIIIGHYSKITTVIYFPVLFLLIDRLLERFRWIDALLAVLTVHFLFEAQHIQLIFYFLFAAAVYLLYLFLRKLMARESVRRILATAGTLVVALGLAFAMSGDRFLSIIEYNEYSTRGSGPIMMTEASKSAPEGGLTYDYATNWSFSPEEVITFLIPSYFGYGIQEYAGRVVHTYFGQMPFTDAPQYMGVITLILAAAGIAYYRRDLFVQSMVLISVIALFISFGKNLPFLYDLMFYHFPFFNKFRVPSMILILVQLPMAVLAGFGVNALIQLKRAGPSDRWKKGLGYSLAAAGGLLVLGIVLRGTLEDHYLSLMRSSDSIEYLTQFRDFQKLPEFLFESMMSDWIVSCLIAVATLGLSYAYLRGSVRHPVWVGGLVLVLLFDLWRVDAKAMRPQPKEAQEEQFATPDYVRFIQQDTTLYRVHLLVGDQPQTDNKLAYYKLQNIYGYHAAKLRVYQDLVEVAGINNPFVWNLLNMKYLIADRVYADSSLKPLFDGTMKVMLNSEYFPRVFFVSRYEVLEPLDILKKLKAGDFNPREVAYLERDPAISVDPPEEAASVQVTAYEIQRLTLRVNATGSNLLFLGEVYYPAGWNATVDGEPTPIYKTDYAFRSILVPQGEHTVELRFQPTMFRIGKTASLTSNVFVLLILVVAVGVSSVRKRKHHGEDTMKNPAHQPEQQP